MSANGQERTVAISVYAPLASSTWPDRSDPSGRVNDTISLYRGNLTCPIATESASDIPPPHLHCLRASTYTLENDQGTVDAANGVVPHAWLDGRHPQILHSWRHGGELGREDGAAALKEYQSRGGVSTPVLGAEAEREMLRQIEALPVV
jgi:hypothetical protein